MVSETCQSHGQNQVSFPVTKGTENLLTQRSLETFQTISLTREAFVLCVLQCWVLNEIYILMVVVGFYFHHSSCWMISLVVWRTRWHYRKCSLSLENLIAH